MRPLVARYRVAIVSDEWYDAGAGTRAKGQQVTFVAVGVPPPDWRTTRPGNQVAMVITDPRQFGAYAVGDVVDVTFGVPFR